MKRLLSLYAMIALSHAAVVLPFACGDNPIVDKSIRDPEVDPIVGVWIVPNHYSAELRWEFTHAGVWNYTRTVESTVWLYTRGTWRRGIEPNTLEFYRSYGKRRLADGAIEILGDHIFWTNVIIFNRESGSCALMFDLTFCKESE